VKKKLILSTIVLCFSLSFYAMQRFNGKLWTQVNGMPSSNKIVFTISSNSEFSRAELVNLLVNGAKKFEVDLKTAYFSNGVLRAYMFLVDQESAFSQVPLILTSEVDFATVDQDIYLSTDKKDPNSSGYLYTVFPLGVSVAEYHSFHDLIYGDAQLFGWYNASSVNIENAKAFTQYIKDLLPNNVHIGSGTYSETNDVSSRNEILLISFLLFVLLLLMEVSKNMKEISLRKSFGEKIGKIIYDLFTPFFLTTLISAILTFTFSYWILIRTINRYTQEYIIQLGFYFLLVIGLTLILLSVLSLVVFFISPVSIIKNRSINQSISNFNFVLKIVFIVFLFPQLLGYARNSIDQSSGLVEYLNYMDIIKSNINRSGLNPNASIVGNQEEQIEQSLQYNYFGIQNSDFFITYNEQDLPDEMLPDSRKYDNYMYIQMTKDYFKYYPLEIKEIDLESINEPILLVSQFRRRNIGFTYKSVCTECKIIVTETEYRIPDFTAMFHASYRSPLLVIYPSIQDVVKLTGIKYMPSGGFYYHSINSTEAILKRDELTNLFGNTWIFTSQESSIRRTITELSIATYYSIIIFLQSLAALILIILHGITVLYDLNRKEIAVHYLVGYSFIQRSSYIVIQDAILFMLLGGYLLLQKFHLIEAVVYALGIALLNLVLASIHLLRNEKNQAIESIKNG